MSDAAWHPDPLGRFELRYWDGSRWTEHVATGGEQQVDPQPLGYEDDAAAVDDTPTADAAPTAEEAVVADDLAGIELEPAGDEWVDAETTSAPADAPPADALSADSSPAEAPPAAGSPGDAAPADAPGTEADATTDDGGDATAEDDPPVVEELPGAAVLGVPVHRDEPAAGDATTAIPPGVVSELGAMPPPTQPAAPAAAPSPGGGDLGADGIGGGLLDDAAYAERSTDRVALQNPRMLKVRLGRDVMIKRGTMIAYQGQMSFSYESEGGGVGGLLKRAVASDNAKMSRVSGQGDLFLADDAFEIHMLELAGGGLVVNGPNLLAFEDGMTFRTRSLGNAGIVAGGVFVTDVSGHGWVAVTCHGTPVRLDTDVPTYVDVGAAVAWSSSLNVDLNVQKLSVKGMRSGEIAQLAFRGQGFVLVQASEGAYVPQTS